MASSARRYQQEMHESIGFFATWLPGDLLELGDTGVLKEGRFRKSNSLRNLGITYRTSKLGAPQNLQYTSKGGTNVSFDGGADGLSSVSISGSIKVEFSSAGSFLFHASNVRNTRLENDASLTEQILAAWRSNKWQKDWYLVESIHEADCATIIVSEDVAAAITFSARGPAAAVPLADPKVNLSVSSSRGKMVQIIAGRKLQPLYSLSRVREGWFTEPSVEPVRGGGGRQSSIFVRTGISELLES